MITRKRLRLAAVATSLAMVANGLFGSVARADVPSGSWSPSSNNGSDPFITLCTSGSQAGLCLYTSEDMLSAGNPSTTGNYYPMAQTHMYFLANGDEPGLNGPSATNHWQDRGAVLKESQYPWVPNGDPGIPVQYRTNHLWAPTMHRGVDGAYYLFVPDLSDDSLSGQHTSSHIGVSKSADASGPFTYVGELTYNGARVPGYMSDPSIMEIDGFGPPTDRSLYLVYADGDFDTCGGLSAAKLDLDMTTLLTAPKKLTVSGLPSGLNSCMGTPGQAYMEGPELYDMSLTAPNFIYPHGDRYLLIFAIKPDNTNAPGCNSSNEAIAYATAPDSYPGGDPTSFTYRGIIMCGSSTQWTNQASIVGYRTTSNGPTPKFILFYHDAATSGVIPQNRRVHAECLIITNAGVQTLVARTTNFDGCMGYGSIGPALPPDPTYFSMGF